MHSRYYTIMEDGMSLKDYFYKINKNNPSEYTFCIHNGKSTCNDVPFGKATTLKETFEKSFVEIKKEGYLGPLLEID